MVQLRIFRVLKVVAIINSVLSPSQALCSKNYCECQSATHPKWETMECRFPEDRILNLEAGDIPAYITEASFSGANAVTIGKHSLSKLDDARILQFVEVQCVRIEQYASQDLDVVSLILIVKDCQTLTIESKAFAKLKGPLNVTITNCTSVMIGTEAFSWLGSFNLENVQELRVSPSAFVLDPQVYKIGKHGSSLKIDFNNVRVNRFSPDTFGSSAASIVLRNSYIKKIVNSTFSANMYSRLEVYNTTIENIENNAFTPSTHIILLMFNRCTVNIIEEGAMRGAISDLKIAFTRIHRVESGAVEVTVVNVNITDSKFTRVKENGLKLDGWNLFSMQRNRIIELKSSAIIASGASVNNLIFTDMEVERTTQNSLGFIGKTWHRNADAVTYRNNYYGQPCNCNVSRWLGGTIDAGLDGSFLKESTCTVDEVVARCYNIHDKNMSADQFMAELCHNEASIKCATTDIIESEGERIEIKNNRFPIDHESLIERDHKIIGIMVVTVMSCILIVSLLSCIKFFRRNQRGRFTWSRVCGNFWHRRGNNRSVDTARSISEIAINEFSERAHLNDIEMLQVSVIPNVYKETENKQHENKMTQTYELTKEHLEDLRALLDDPEKYTEARKTIEHMYELIKVEEICPSHTPPFHTSNYQAANIYEEPFVRTLPRLGKNNSNMISVGTSTPSLDRLTIMSPYDRATALLQDYGEPQDMKNITANLYSEINGHSDKDLDGRQAPAEAAVPDVVARGPYLKAMRQKISTSIYPTSKTSGSSKYSSPKFDTINKAICNGFGDMSNRPLPAKPVTFDPGEGPSSRL